MKASENRHPSARALRPRRGRPCGSCGARGCRRTAAAAVRPSRRRTRRQPVRPRRRHLQGSSSGVIRGPDSPVPASIWRQPAYSWPAAAEMGTTWSTVGHRDEIAGEGGAHPRSGGLARGERDAVEADHGGRVARELGHGGQAGGSRVLDGELQQHVAAAPRDHDVAVGRAGGSVPPRVALSRSAGDNDRSAVRPGVQPTSVRRPLPVLEDLPDHALDAGSELRPGRVVRRRAPSR